MVDINVELRQWFINVGDKKTPVSGIKNENISNRDLDEELHKPLIKKRKERKVHSTFIDNIWDADLADTQLLSLLI